MEVINDGQHITIKATFWETASMVEAIRKSIHVYEKEGSHEFAEQSRELIEELTNKQRVVHK